MTEKTSKPQPTPVQKRLDHVVRLATAAAFWEGLWRGLIPPLVVVGAFLCVSWLGLWLDVSHIGRVVGVTIFGILFALSTFGLWTLVPLSRREALNRIDKASGLDHRPASVLDDTLATAGRDPSTDALWALHRKRAEAEAARLRPGRPSPRAAELDRYALRGGIVVALVACAIVAGPQRYARVAAAFDFGEGPALGSSYRLDAWIDPPPYTGKPPVLIDLAADSARDADHPRSIAAPAGSVVIIRSSGGDPAEIETTGPLLPPPAKPVEPGKAGETKSADAKADEASQGPAGQVPGDSEKRLVLHGDSRLVLRHDGSLRGIFDLTAIADKPPTIMLRDVPKANARGSLTLAYTTSDDYGVSKAEALFSDPMIDGTPIDGPPLVGAPKGELALPGVSGSIGDAETTLDLSDSPWAGTQVKMVLVAHDEGGNEGRSEPVTITLPEKPFTNPVARALVEQRRELVLNPHKKGDVKSALDAMMIAPDVFGTTASIYLGLRFASTSLERAQTDQDQIAVADFLWDMAQQIENGDLTEAEKALRNAEKELRDAIDRHASDEDIQKLTKNLRAAMDKFLKELAQQQQKQDQQAQNQQSRNAKSISQKDLQALIDKLEQQARSGNREEAKKALEQLQDVLENLKTAKRQQKADPQARAMAEGLNQLDQAMRDQQDLRDQTYKKGQQGQQQQGQQNQDEDQQLPGGRDPGQSQGMNSGPGPKGQQHGRRSQGQQDGQDEGQEGGGGKSSRGEGGGDNLQQRQQELRDRLSQIQKKLKQAGEGQGDLDEAGKAMREAEQALREGESGNSDAVDQQGKALDAMRRGAKKLADAMSQQGDPNGQANGENDGGTGSREGQQSQNDDPLGRPRGGTNTLNSLSRFDPLGVPAAQRAQRVLEELRRRLGDPSRAQEEIDYLERLLHSY